MVAEHDNGLLFEQTTSLDVALEDAGYNVVAHKVYDGVLLFL